MFQISDETILRNCDEMTLEMGRGCYRTNRVRTTRFNKERLTFESIVAGIEDCRVNISFNNRGELENAFCSCEKITEGQDYCKHIVAVLLLIKDRDDRGFFKELRFRQSARQIFGLFQGRSNQAKTRVELEVTYEYRKSGAGGEANSSLSLRIGQERLYIVKNIRKLLESIEKNEPLEFGKHFTFDPSKHDFRDEQKALIEFLKELYENDRLMDSVSYGYTRGSLFREKEVYLSNAGVRRFFSIYSDKMFKAEINGNAFDSIGIINHDFPVKFNLTKDGNDLLLSIDFEGKPVPLTEEGEYFFVLDSIYRVSKIQQENFKPFFLAIAYQRSNKLRFIEEDKERFVSEVLPFAEKAGKLVISENVKSMIEKLPLEAEIYLDRTGSSVTAEVRFVYGERSINPFAPVEKGPNPSDKILIRDVEKERIILDILGELDFKVRDGRIHLEGDDSIFNFAVDSVPRLQEYSSVFYSDSFRKMAVKSFFSFNGRVRLNAGTDMLEISFGIEGIDTDELFEILKSFRMKKRYHQLKNGSFLNLDSRELSEMNDFVENLGLDEGDLKKDFFAVPKYRAFYVDGHMRESGLSFLERNHAFKEFVQNVREPSDMDFSIPSGLKAIFRDYQRFGFKWLKTLAWYGLGGILADDMGLGKTLQVIALILSDKIEKGVCPSLVVVPTSLVFNWYAEVEKFAPNLKVVSIYGSKEERLAQIEAMGDADIVITSYPLIRRDIDDYKGFRFRYCILDEAQHIKNPDSQNARSVKLVNSEKRFALTGTPVENSLTELWSIFDFILPGYLFTHGRFMQNYESPIAKGEGKKELAELGRQIRPFILRRIKRDVLKELPDKIENKMVVELEEGQKKVYMAYLQQVKGEIEQEISVRGFERSHIKILAALTRLRQICCHPGLFIDDYRGESGKLQMTEELVQESLESGHRILLFSQFTSMLAIVRKRLEEQNVECMYLDGSVDTEERMRLVDAFNSGKGKVFLISLKAGGTGLNLTGADTVIHYDPWWNPAVEEQATDRAYRIGQQKVVHVMKLITKGTIEEKIFNLQERKRQLIDAVIQPGETLLTKMTQEEVRGLFN